MENVDTTTWSYPQGPSTERGRATHLSSSPDGKKFAYGSMNNAIVRETDVTIFLQFLFIEIEPCNRIQIFHKDP